MRMAFAHAVAQDIVTFMEKYSYNIYHFIEKKLIPSMINLLWLLNIAQTL